MKKRRFMQVDVFTDRPMMGNPVAVILDGDGLSSAIMQRTAAWTNLSETVFVRAADDEGIVEIKIFTPRSELPFAGHPTLGAAHALLKAGRVFPAAGVLRLRCGVGVVDVAVSPASDDDRLMLKIPRCVVHKFDDTEFISSVFAKQKQVTDPLRIDLGPVWVVAEAQSVEALNRINPDYPRLSKLSAGMEITGATVFARDNEFVHVRSFPPASGILEDPVCGSGNAAVAAYLRHYEPSHLPRHHIAKQGGCVGRDGTVAVHYTRDTIEIGGSSVTVFDGIAYLGDK